MDRRLAKSEGAADPSNSSSVVSPVGPGFWSGLALGVVGLSVVVVVTVGVELSVVGSGHREDIMKLDLVYTRYMHYC